MERIRSLLKEIILLLFRSKKGANSILINGVNSVVPFLEWRQNMLYPLYVYQITLANSVVWQSWVLDKYTFRIQFIWNKSIIAPSTTSSNIYVIFERQEASSVKHFVF